MEKRLGSVMIVIGFLVFVLIAYMCSHSSNRSRVIDSGVPEKAQDQLVSEVIDEWDGVNVGPRPSEIIVPTVTEVDSIPVN